VSQGVTEMGKRSEEREPWGSLKEKSRGATTKAQRKLEVAVREGRYEKKKEPDLHLKNYGQGARVNTGMGPKLDGKTNEPQDPRDARSAGRTPAQSRITQYF